MPVYYRRRRGAVLSVTISKHCYILIHPYFNRKQTLLKYSQTELLTDIEAARHPIFREALKELWPSGGIEIVSTADIPSGTGLGSSSTFSVALLQALYAYRGTFCSKEKLARKACQLEIERLGEPIGKQDQYAAAYGGLNLIEFQPDENVLVSPLMLPAETLTALEQNLLLFYLGGRSTKPARFWKTRPGRWPPTRRPSTTSRGWWSWPTTCGRCSWPATCPASPATCTRAGCSNARSRRRSVPRRPTVTTSGPRNMGPWAANSWAPAAPASSCCTVSRQTRTGSARPSSTCATPLQIRRQRRPHHLRRRTPHRRRLFRITAASRPHPYQPEA